MVNFHRANVLNRLRSMRGPGESYSDVIIQLAAGERSD
jgi:predicted CopG family antitoxin